MQNRTYYLGEGFGNRNQIFNNTIALYHGENSINGQNHLIVNTIDDKIYVSLAYPNVNLETSLSSKYQKRKIDGKKYFYIPDEKLNLMTHDFYFTNLNYDFYSQIGDSLIVWQKSELALQYNLYIGFSDNYLQFARVIFDSIATLFVVSKISFYNKNKMFEINFYCDNIEFVNMIFELISNSFQINFTMKHEDDIVIVEFDASFLGVSIGQEESYNSFEEN